MRPAVVFGTLILLGLLVVWTVESPEDSRAIPLEVEESASPRNAHSPTEGLGPVRDEVKVEPALVQVPVAEAESAPLPGVVPEPGWESFDPEKSKKLYPLPWDDWEGELPKVPLYVYEEKYDGSSADDLRLAKKELNDFFTTTVEAAFDQLFAEGDYTTHYIQYEDDGNGNRTPIGMDISRSGDTPLFRIYSTKDPNGELIRQFLWIRPEDERFRDLYLTLRELNWVASKVAKADFIKMQEQGHL